MQIEGIASYSLLKRCEVSAFYGILFVSLGKATGTRRLNMLYQLSYIHPGGGWQDLNLRHCALIAKYPLITALTYIFVCFQ